MRKGRRLCALSSICFRRCTLHSHSLLPDCVVYSCVERKVFYSMGWGRRCAAWGEFGPNMKMNESSLRCKVWPFLGWCGVQQHAGGACSLSAPARPHSHPISDWGAPPQRDFCEPFVFAGSEISPVDNQSLICLCLSSNRHCMMCLGGPQQVFVPNKPLDAKHDSLLRRRTSRLLFPPDKRI